MIRQAGTRGTGKIVSETGSRVKRVPVFLFTVIFLLLFMQRQPAPQVRDPELPVSPEINYKESIERRTWPVTVTFNGGSVTGDIDPGAEFFADPDKGTPCFWKDIGSIRITSWVRHVKGRAYAFYPETYEVILKSGSKLQFDGNIKELNRFRIIKKGQSRTMYTYYFDDYINGSWAATGMADFYSPVLNPARGCVVSIDFR